MKAIDKEKRTIVELANHICECEGVRSIPVRFCRVGRGGASVTFSGKKCYSINIDIERISIGAAYVLAHEVAHCVLICKSGNYKHDKDFKTLNKVLERKYVNCPLARKLIF
jgi:hypothetical protein